MKINDWKLDFISKENFYFHVSETISTYISYLKPVNLESFNGNIIDPIKLTFDSKIQKISIEEIINSEILRQRDKANNNAIGYFHQNIFKYIKNCNVPIHGWDVIFTTPLGTRIFVEMKNKHNTMNSSSSENSFLKMLNILSNNPNDKCYLVEAISTTSQKVNWTKTINGKEYNSTLIQKVSIDKFLEEVTGDSYAFKKICDELPVAIDILMEKIRLVSNNQDSVIAELKNINDDLLKALYAIAFEDYNGFDLEE
jgi:type II restriction enzyme